MQIEYREKIIDLFEYRELPKIIALGNHGTLDERLYENLIKLQYHIYLLDSILENNWLVPSSKIKEAWTAIHADLIEIGIDRNSIDEYCRHIYKYQKHELELREYKLPERLTMEYFYFYKSCDVKLLRRIIYDKYPKLKRENKLSDWRVFDLITEINDDVEDVYEDLYTINGNRFLLGILKNGVTKTHNCYLEFLTSLKPRILNRSTTIDIMTRRAYDATVELLNDTIKTIDLEKIESAIIKKRIFDKNICL